MFTLAVAIVVGACLAAILVLVARKFPSLALIDTESLQRERDAKKKHAIIEDRVERIMKERWASFSGAFAPAVRLVKKWLRDRHRQVLALERQLERTTLSDAQVEGRVAKLREQADALLAAGKWEAAEEKYVDVISWDAGDMRAYAGLGDAYLAMKEDEQAKETFLYLLHMRLKKACPGPIGKTSPVAGGLAAADERSRTCGSTPAERADIARDYANFAIASRQLGQYVAASDAFLNAVAFEPSNPRYLDLLLETCILGGQKVRALDAYARLREVNPDNQKLQPLWERIQAMAEEK